MSESLVRGFAEAAGVAVESVASCAAAVADAVDRGARAWPAIAREDRAFAAFLGARAGAAEPAAALAEMHVEDLYLAFGCLRGDREALVAFDTEMATPIRVALSKLDVADALKQDSAQTVRERLFVGTPDREPRIADYSGRGQLKRWVQAAVVRACLDQVRAHKREVPLDGERAAGMLPAADAGPELEHFRRVYGEVFQRAFEAAIGSLDDRQRTVLRHHLVDGMTIDDIGALYDVHRTTAFRWIERARETLVERTRDEMMARLDVAQPEVDSILRVIRSQVHLSVQRHFEAA
jgi:RNA polymerase sigma-70 factor (ECF subfamily)